MDLGSIRRECVDHIIVVGERHLRHALLSYKDYYNLAHSFVIEQGCSSPSRRRASREYCLPPDPGRSPSSLCPDLIYDKHSPFGRPNAIVSPSEISGRDGHALVKGHHPINMSPKSRSCQPAVVVSLVMADRSHTFFLSRLSVALSAHVS